MKLIFACKQLSVAACAVTSASTLASVSCNINVNNGDSPHYDFEYKVKNASTRTVKNWSMDLQLGEAKKNLITLRVRAGEGFPKVRISSELGASSLAVGKAVRFVVRGKHSRDAELTPPVCIEGVFTTPPGSSVINLDRSLVVHDEATLDAANISLNNAMDILAKGMTAKNPGDSIKGNELFKPMWDAQNPKAVTETGGCGNTQSMATRAGGARTLEVACRPEEGKRAVDANAINRYKLIALVNRFDLHDRDFTRCGEYRLVFGLRDGAGLNRNFINFEADVANNRNGDGCLAIQNFGKDQSFEEVSASKGVKLARFYLNGLPDVGKTAPINVVNFSAEEKSVEGAMIKSAWGQVRTIQFSEGTSWLLKEYQIDQNSARNALQIAAVKNNPVGDSFKSTTTEANNFRSKLLDKIETLLADPVTVGFLPRITGADNIQSHSSNSIFPGADAIQRQNLLAENDFGNKATASFKQAIAEKLALLNVVDVIAPDQLLNRATAMTCSDCHNPNAFNDVPIKGSGTVEKKWPQKQLLNEDLFPANLFLHIREKAAAGNFPLSNALKKFAFAGTKGIYGRLLSENYWRYLYW